MSGTGEPEVCPCCCSAGMRSSACISDSCEIPTRLWTGNMQVVKCVKCFWVPHFEEASCKQGLLIAPAAPATRCSLWPPKKLRRTLSCVLGSSFEGAAQDIFVFGRVVMTQSWQLNISLLCHSNTAKGSAKCSTRRSMAPGCPHGGVWRDKCDNHTLGPLGRALRSSCHVTLRSQLSEKRCGLWTWSPLSSAPSEMSGPVGLGEPKKWRGGVSGAMRGSGGCTRSGQEKGRTASCPRWHTSCVVTQGCFWLTTSGTKWPGTVVRAWFNTILGCAVGSGAMTATTQEEEKPNFSSSRRKITFLVRKASHSAVIKAPGPTG